MPRLVRRLVLSYAPENVVIEAAGPELGAAAPQAWRRVRGPTHVPACLSRPAWGLTRPRGYSGQTGEARPSALLSVPWWAVIRSPHRQTHPWSFLPSALDSLQSPCRGFL